MKKQIKVYKGYVPKGETIEYTIEMFTEVNNKENKVTFGMHKNKKSAAREEGADGFVKRTITITSEDEEVK